MNIDVVNIEVPENSFWQGTIQQRIETKPLWPRIDIVYSKGIFSDSSIRVCNGVNMELPDIRAFIGQSLLLFF